MASPLTVAQFKTRTIMPGADVDQLESVESGYLQARLDGRWSWIQARLRKRYDVAAMQANPPEIALIWLTDLVTLDAYGKRGWNPSSESDRASILDPAQKAETEVKEAADSKDGLFDLPLLASTTSSGVSKGGPLGYSETSPYVGMDLQACIGRDEDRSGRGT